MSYDESIHTFFVRQPIIMFAPTMQNLNTLYTILHGLLEVIPSKVEDSCFT